MSGESELSRRLPAMIARVALAAVLFLPSGCTGRGVDALDPCAQREDYARQAADAQGRYDYARRSCDGGRCSPRQRALMRVYRKETGTLRELTAKCDALCRR